MALNAALSAALNALPSERFAPRGRRGPMEFPRSTSRKVTPTPFLLPAHQRAVHVDVVEDRHAREIRACVDAFIEHDIDADDRRTRSDRRERLSRIRWIDADSRPPGLR